MIRYDTVLYLAFHSFVSVGAHSGDGCLDTTLPDSWSRRMKRLTLSETSGASQSYRRQGGTPRIVALGQDVARGIRHFDPRFRKAVSTKSVQGEGRSVTFTNILSTHR